MTYLSLYRDGLVGIDLGVFGECQYAITFDGQMMRRKASEFGTYGGWRWECSSGHVVSATTVYPGVAEKMRKVLVNHEQLVRSGGWQCKRCGLWHRSKDLKCWDNGNTCSQPRETR